MKKFLLSFVFIFLLAGFSAAARAFVEGTDYFADFKQNEDNMAAVLHINFISLMPAPAEAESILKDQLKLYASIIEAEKETAKKEKEEEEKELAKKDKTKKDKSKDKKKEKPKTIEEIKNPEELKAFFAEEDAKEEKFKNIIGSVWYTADGDPETAEKIQYSDNSSAFVFIGKTKKIVPFPDYIRILKKEKEDRKQKEKERAQLIKQLSQKGTDEDMTEELEEPQP